MIRKIGIKKYSAKIADPLVGKSSLYEILRKMLSNGSCAAKTKKLAPLNLISHNFNVGILPASATSHHKLGTPKTIIAL